MVRLLRIVWSLCTKGRKGSKSVPIHSQSCSKLKRSLPTHRRPPRRRRVHRTVVPSRSRSPGFVFQMPAYTARGRTSSPLGSVAMEVGMIRSYGNVGYSFLDMYCVCVLRDGVQVSTRFGASESYNLRVSYHPPKKMLEAWSVRIAVD